MVISQSNLVGTEQRQGRSQTLSGGTEQSIKEAAKWAFYLSWQSQQIVGANFSSAQRSRFAFYPVISVFLGSALTATIIKLGYAQKMTCTISTNAFRSAQFASLTAAEESRFSEFAVWVCVKTPSD